MLRDSNNKLYDPTGFKEEIKIKFDAIEAVDKNFSNGTGAMMELFKAEPIPLKQTWANYCTMPVVEQLIWEERGVALIKSILSLMNSKNNNVKKHLCLAYSQGNKKAYPL